MRPTIALIILILAAQTAAALQTGYCTGTYEEKSAEWKDGLVQPGDVFTYYCELPTTITGNEPLELTITYPNSQATTGILTPRIITGTTLVIFP